MTLFFLMPSMNTELLQGARRERRSRQRAVRSEKPKFRLSCRAADWFGSQDQDVLRAASASGRVVVLELCPLSHDEILTAVEPIVPDPVVFLDEAESAGLGKSLGNPQTLELIARAWGRDKKPRKKFDAYEIGISELLKETNEYHARSVLRSR